MSEPDRLHQINLGYSPEEDRILLRINTTGKTEYRLWMTRRYVKILWKLLTKSVESLPGVQAQAARAPSSLCKPRMGTLSI